MSWRRKRDLIQKVMDNPWLTTRQYTKIFGYRTDSTVTVHLKQGGLVLSVLRRNQLEDLFLQGTEFFTHPSEHNYNQFKETFFHFVVCIRERDKLYEEEGGRDKDQFLNMLNTQGKRRSVYG